MSDEAYLSRIANTGPPQVRPRMRREDMKTMILTLAAVLGFAAGAASLAPAAQASRTCLFQPHQNEGSNG